VAYIEIKNTFENKKRPVLLDQTTRPASLDRTVKLPRIDRDRFVQ